MLACLMRWLLASALLLALGLLATGVARGETLWGLLGFLAVVAVHGWTIGLECVWGEAVVAPQVFFWRQPFGHNHEPDHLPGDAMGRRGVLLVHGFFCNRGFWNGWMARLRAQGTPFVAVTLEPPFAGIDAYVATIDAAAKRLRATTGLPPVIVAHSMGGLASRVWAARTQARPGEDVHRLISLGTPHQGTAVAVLAFSRNGRQMRRGSAWLRELASDPSAPALAAATTAFYSPCDNIVFPPTLAQWPGAEMRALQAPAHVAMADRNEPWEELQHWLRS
jgi:triacylglycerol lipase